MAKKRVKLENLGSVLVEQVKTDSALEYKASAFELFSQVIQKTPVLTGRARGNWNISTDSPDYSTSSSTMTPAIPLNLDTGSFAPVYISNGLEYVGLLEEGRSDQAPAGIFTPAIAAARANRRR